MSFLIFSSIYFAVANAGAVLISLSGLPGRGKSAMVKALIKKWKAEASSQALRGENSIAESKIFNAGDTRREEEMAGKTFSFDSGEDANKERNRLAEKTLDNALNWLADKVNAHPDEHFVAFFDATNSDLDRRATVAQKVNEFNVGRDSQKRIDHFFLESIGEDQDILSWSYRSKKTNGDHGDALRKKLGLLPILGNQADSEENVKIESHFEAAVIFGLLVRTNKYVQRYVPLSLEERNGELMDDHGQVSGAKGVDYISITDCGQNFGVATSSTFINAKSALREKIYQTLKANMAEWSSVVTTLKRDAVFQSVSIAGKAAASIASDYGLIPKTEVDLSKSAIFKAELLNSIGFRTRLHEILMKEVSKRPTLITPCAHQPHGCGVAARLARSPFGGKGSGGLRSC